MSARSIMLHLRIKIASNSMLPRRRPAGQGENRPRAKGDKAVRLWSGCLFLSGYARSVLRGGLGGLGRAQAHRIGAKRVAPLSPVRQLGGLGGLGAGHFRALSKT